MKWNQGGRERKGRWRLGGGLRWRWSRRRQRSGEESLWCRGGLRRLGSLACF